MRVPLTENTDRDCEGRRVTVQAPEGGRADRMQRQHSGDLACPNEMEPGLGWRGNQIALRTPTTEGSRQSEEPQPIRTANAGTGSGSAGRRGAVRTPEVLVLASWRARAM